MRSNPRHSSSTKLALLTLVIFGLLIAFFRALPVKSSPLIKAVDLSGKWSFNYQDAELLNRLKPSLKDVDGVYAVYIEPLTGSPDEKVTLNASEIFPAASLYKLFLLSATLNEVEKGKLKLNDNLKAKISHLKELVGEDFGYEDFDDQDDLEYSVDEAITRVATISDNYAAILLVDKIGWAKVQDQANTLGAISTTIKDPISTSASDIGLYFKKLYNKQVVSTSVSDKIIDLLSRSKINDRIPNKLPENVKIAHKTAELANVRHDAGIVFLAQKPYVIVLMSKNLKYEDDGVEVLANLSSEVYEYFNNKHQ